MAASDASRLALEAVVGVDGEFREGWVEVRSGVFDCVWGHGEVVVFINFGDVGGGVRDGHHLSCGETGGAGRRVGGVGRRIFAASIANGHGGSPAFGKFQTFAGSDGGCQPAFEEAARGAKDEPRSEGRAEERRTSRGAKDEPRSEGRAEERSEELELGIKYSRADPVLANGGVRPRI